MWQTFSWQTKTVSNGRINLSLGSKATLAISSTVHRRSLSIDSIEHTHRIEQNFRNRSECSNCSVFWSFYLCSASARLSQGVAQSGKAKRCETVNIYIDICNMVNHICHQSLAAHNRALRVPLPGQQKLYARSGGGVRRTGGLSRCGTGAIWQVIG